MASFGPRTQSGEQGMPRHSHYGYRGQESMVNTDHGDRAFLSKLRDLGVGSSTLPELNGSITNGIQRQREKRKVLELQ